MLASLFDEHIRIQRQRTDEAMALCEFDTLAIHAGSPHMLFLDDHPYPFKPNPHFKLWLPLEDAVDCWLVYRPGEKPRLIFLQPADYWHKPPSLPHGFWTHHFQIEVIREPAEARRHLTHLGRCALIGEWQQQFAEWGFAESNPETLLHRLHYPRAIKTEYELECMRQASHSAARGHVAAEAAFRAGKSEYEIHMTYVRATGHSERELPYSNIVALNTNASVLHYQHQERETPAEHRSFLIDAGAQFHTYAADVTRTYAFADGDFAALVAGMESLQLQLCAEVRDGVDYAKIHVDAHMRIAGLLHDSGVITLSAADAVTSGLSAVFFPHGVGHLLGLQVHDVSGFSVDATGTQKARPAGHPYLRLTRTLEPGFVVTIEPGLYFIDMLLEEARNGAHGRHINWHRVEEFRPYGGIRVEDDVACTAGEPENLTRAAFAALA
ncbi:MAG TPA: Xaa-Pro dipeptidase [Steroidobacteraceae bacterium]|jgi:Xaa-Pro dipeptidase|nr:Xaa-Pro dipeptidase [Steroidobacteraceae bacterium]